VPNLSLSQAAAPLGLRYAPDPSSQVVSTLGGNVATNAGGAHCLGHGVTSNHVLWVDLLDADGVVHRLGSTAPEGSGLDLRALAVGSEGTFGLVTAACLRLIPIAPATVTLLAGFPSVRSAAEAVADVVQHLGRLVALELMDRTAVQLVEAYAPAGYPTGAGAVLLAELEGLPHAVADDTRTAVELIGRHRGGPVQVAESAERRALLWKGRKSVAGAMARLKPDYYLHDCVVPRSRLADVVDEIEGIAARHGLTVVSCHHAGDGNLHPLLPFDKSDPEELEHALIAGHEILAAALAHGGVVTGEHGVGIEKRDLLCEAFSGPELDLQRAVRHALDPSGRCNPGKVLPSPATCGELPAALVPEGAWI
jgi:glycolate oxidase